MNFDNLNSNQKTIIWNRLCELAVQKDKTKDYSSLLRKEEKELEEKLKESSGLGGLILIFLIFSGTPALLTLLIGFFTSDEKSLRFIKSIWDYKELVVLGLLLIIFLSWIIRLPKIRKKRKIKKQLANVKEKIRKLDEAETQLKLEIKNICNQYSIPSEVVYPKGLKYIKELVEVKRFDYSAAFSLCIKNAEEINRPSLSEISKRFPLGGSQRESYLESFLTFPFRFAGALLGIDKESIKRAQRAKYYQSMPTNDSSNEIAEFNDKQSTYTFMDGNGNLNESGNMFYDGKGNPCEWGQPFYDGKGNYIKWGEPFYDGKGNYCMPGQPFYDSKGNLINPH